MSLFGKGHVSYSLKDLLENPILQNPPQLNKDGGNLKNKEKGGFSPTFDPTSAFLGPNLWSTPDFKEGDISLEYMDLDEFLSENGIPVDLNENSNGSNNSRENIPIQALSPKAVEPDSTQIVTEALSPLSIPPASPQSETHSEENINVEEGNECCSPLNIEFKITEQEVAMTTIPVLRNEDRSSPDLNVEFDIDEEEHELVNVPGEECFDPKSRKFSEDELKPQPMIKKSRKVFVPDEQKDDKYWCRRKKNNVAAKRSRDARRVKENQIAMRASYLERCNNTLTAEVQKLKKENAMLKKSLEESQKQLKT